MKKVFGIILFGLMVNSALDACAFIDPSKIPFIAQKGRLSPKGVMNAIETAKAECKKPGVDKVYYGCSEIEK